MFRTVETVGQNGCVATGGKIATHSDPVWRDRTNFIIQADLTPHGLPGSFEQLWTRTEDEGRTFEICCIPFFIYGIALGDVVSWDKSTHLVQLVEGSGHRCIRVAFQDKAVGAARHEELHRLLAGQGPLIEFNSDGYGAIDIQNEPQATAIISALAARVEDGTLIWEWADS